MRKFLMLMILFAGCWDLSPPQQHECLEFERQTMRHGRPIVCRILWCSKHESSVRIGGPSVLWCEE